MSNLAGVALLVSLLAVGVAGYTLVQEPAGSQSDDLDMRLTALEDHLARIEKTLEEQGRPSTPPPTLLGMGERPADEVLPGRTPAARGAASGADPSAPDPSATDTAASTALPGTAEEIAELVDKAVAKKAAQMQVMRNKKPSADVFAKTLELTDVQRKAAEEEIVRAQHGIKEILETPAADGTLFLDELVETVAHGMATPGKNPGRMVRLFGRLMSEKIPGTDETYAGRIEGLKQGVRASFKRNWNEKQYATFEAWRMDPTEVQDIPGSPWKQLGERMLERAKELGAEIPDPDDGD